ncbi:TRAP transporter small permease subunit [Teichococcus wenyumeiae]|nr:TRAP transporter small permease subunit [Pseudoroseomonas wenyumeiae]
MTTRTAAAPPQGMSPALAVLRAFDALGALAGIIAVLCLVTLLGLILLEVALGILGKLAPSMAGGLNFAWEYSAYLMGGVFLFGAAAGLRAGSHVRVTLLLSQARGGGLLALEVISTLIGLGVTGFMAWALARFTIRAWTLGQMSSGSLTPLWIPDALLATGAALLALQFLARLLRLALGLPTEDESLKAGSVAE